MLKDDVRFNSLRYSRKIEIDPVDSIRVKKAVSMIGNNKKVLDLGCGNGLIMERIRDAGNIVIGVEISKAGILESRKKGFKVYELSLNYQWSKRIREKFDVVFAGEIIEHIFDTDKFLTNVKGVLHDGGNLIVTTPNLASLGRRIALLFGRNPYIETTCRLDDAGHIRYFTLKTLTNLLEENSFKVKEFESVVVNLSPWGKPRSEILAKLFPKLGNTLIILAQKC
jgi:methionine biosynthesis protein MetW